MAERPKMVQVHVSETERDVFQRAAEAEGMSLSAWVRSTLKREVRKLAHELPTDAKEKCLESAHS